MNDQEWYGKMRKDRYPWMSDDQMECFRMLCDLVGGAHHLLGKVKQCGTGIEINIGNGGWSTYDYDGLTRAVVLAHERMIRFEISPSGPGRLRLHLHKRKSRTGGDMWDRHPTIEDAIERIRGKK